MARILPYILAAGLTYAFASQVGPEVKRMYESLDAKVQAVVEQTERLR